MISGILFFIIITMEPPSLEYYDYQENLERALEDYNNSIESISVFSVLSLTLGGFLIFLNSNNR